MLKSEASFAGPGNLQKSDGKLHARHRQRPQSSSASRLTAAGGRKRKLQVLFYRGISDRDVNQSSILKPRDELVVFDRIEGDATGAPPEHAIIFGAKGSGGVPVRVDDPFERWSVADVTVVRGDAIEHYNDHIWINGSVVRSTIVL